MLHAAQRILRERLDDPLVENTIGLAGKVIEQMDPRGGLGHRLERARLPLRPGEYGLVIVRASIFSYDISPKPSRYFRTPTGPTNRTSRTMYVTTIATEVLRDRAEQSRPIVVVGIGLNVTLDPADVALALSDERIL